MMNPLVAPRIFFALMALLMLAWLPGKVFAVETLVLGDQAARVMPLAKHQEFHDDVEDVATLDDFLAGRRSFTPSERDVVNLGARDGSVWLHLKIRAEISSQSPEWVMELAFSRLSRVDIYLVQAGALQNTWRIGYENPMSVRELPHNFFAQPLYPRPGQTYDIYLNIKRKGGGIQAPLTFYRADAFASKNGKSNLLYGVYFGVMLAMLAYNAFLLLSVGNRAYVYYLAHICGTMGTFFVVYGYGFLYLWPNAPIVNEYAIQLSVCFAAMAAMLFERHYIEVWRYAAWMGRLMWAVLALGAGIMLTRIFTTHAVIVPSALFLAVVSVVMFLVAFLCWRQGSRPAGFFLIAWTVFLCGILMHLLTYGGYLPTNDITTYFVVMGSTLEVLLLSLGLADRINTERRHRYAALQEKHEAIVELKNAEARIVERATHSTTTGLPNRAFLRSFLENICIPGVAREPVSVILVCLKNFHEFNKTLGHRNGDAILCLMAERIAQSVREHNGSGVLALETLEDRQHYVACIEGVVFAVLVRGQRSDVLQEFAGQLLQNTEKTFDFQGLTLSVNATVGIARYPDHASNADDLLRNAHIALEMADAAGGRIAIYSREMDPYNARRLSMLAELLAAIDKDLLQLHVQPQISLQDYSIVGAEVLLRWVHPEFGFVSPAEFIPLAERTGVINPLTYWVCRKTFELGRQLQGEGVALSINISASNLHAVNFTRDIVAMARQVGVDLGMITMELTETAVMLDPADAMLVMKELSDAGIRLSIDDFGTGYSSLSYLKRLPVNEIKIDRSFVKELQENAEDSVIVQTTLLMGHNLGLKVVAEGIEDAATLQLLQGLGCDMAQGYYIARPMPVIEFLAWLKRYREPQALQSALATGH